MTSSMLDRWPTMFAFVISLAIASTVANAAELANAHGDPKISVTPNPAEAGSTVTIEGEEFEEGEDISLVLEGVSGEVALGMVTADDEGSFHTEVALSESAGPGSYRLRAETEDATALADLKVTATAGSGAPEPAAHERSIGFHSGGPLGEVIGLSVLVAVLALLGAGLLLWREQPTP